MTRTRLFWALLTLVPGIVGLIIGMGIAGALAEKPYIAERQLVAQHIKNDKKKFSMACAIVAWTHDTPVDEDWWQECLRGFADT